jgi:hypothetical protein
MYVVRLPHANPLAYICVAQLAVFICLFHKACFAATLFLAHQFSGRAILGLCSFHRIHRP